MLRMFRSRPDRWAALKLGVEFPPRRTPQELREFLRNTPGRHEWARAALSQSQLTLAPAPSHQVQALRALARPGRHLWRWANSAGKTVTEALAVLWFLDCFPDGACVTTAGTWSQIRDQLWREIGYWHGRAAASGGGDSASGDDLALTVPESALNKVSIDLDDKWFAVGRAASDERTFEGIHARDIMVIFDEAKAVEDPIWGAARRILRGSDWREVRLWWIAASSPGSPFGAFYEASGSDTWSELHVSAYETTMVGLEQIDDDAVELGEDSPLFQSMVLAQFPQEGDDVVIPLSLVQACVNTTPSQNDADAATARTPAADAPTILGVDVARYGSAETVVSEQKLGYTRAIHTWQYAPVTETAGRVERIALSRGLGSRQIVVDDSGVGGGVSDILAERNWEPIRIHNGSVARQPDRYANWITEAWFSYRRMMREGMVSIPDDRKLINQLSSRRYEVLSDGRLRLEPKERLRRNGRASPDRAEAVIYGAVGALSGLHAETQFLAPVDDEAMGEFFNVYG